MLWSGVPELGGQTHSLQCLHKVPGGVHLPPLQAVAGGVLKGVVVVVPALTKGKDADEPRGERKRLRTGVQDHEFKYAEPVSAVTGLNIVDSQLTPHRVSLISLFPILSSLRHQI